MEFCIIWWLFYFFYKFILIRLLDTLTNEISLIIDKEELKEVINNKLDKAILKELGNYLKKKILKYKHMI